MSHLGVHQLRSVLDHVPELIAVLDRDQSVRAFAGRVEPVLGADWTRLIGRPMRELAHTGDADALATLLADVAGRDPGATCRGEWRLSTAAGTHIEVESVATNRLGDPSLDGIVVTISDVRDRNAVEAGLRHRAQHDDLTGLPNRFLFYDRLERALADTQSEARAGLLFVDLDDFKALNDAHGHAAGDAVLIEVARRLRSCLREHDTAARISGDEFAVIVRGVGGTDEPVGVAQRILGALSGPVQLGGTTVQARASIGVAVSDTGERGPEGLLERADRAMYAAKRNGKSCWQLYSAETAAVDVPEHSTASWFAQTTEQRDEVLALLERPDVIVPVFQPIVDLRTGLVAGYEALARFLPPFRRPPNTWFEQAHRVGLGGRLEVQALLAAIAAPGRSPDHWLSVNVSPSALASPELLESLPDRLDGIVIEITETEHIPDVGPVGAAIDDLRARGALLALDDTGSGYAGLQHVIRLAPDMIKLDRSLVDGVHADPGRAALIEAFVRYARESHATVCAEGIESFSDLERLADLDVTLGQGWAIGHPGKPWAGIDPGAAAMCRDAIARSLCRPHGLGTAHPSYAATALAHDRRLEAVVAELAAATTYADLHAAMDGVKREIHADYALASEIDGPDLVEIGSSGPITFGERYRIADFPATVRVLRTLDATQIFEGDPDADRAEVELLREQNFRSLLMLPITCGPETLGLFEAFSHVRRPWSRFELSRARILCLQLGAALERIQRNAPRSRGTAPRRLRLVPPAS